MSRRRRVGFVPIVAFVVVTVIPWTDQCNTLTQLKRHDIMRLVCADARRLTRCRFISSSSSSSSISRTAQCDFSRCTSLTRNLVTLSASTALDSFNHCSTTFARPFLPRVPQRRPYVCLPPPYKCT